MTARVFLSYRRSDNALGAGRLHERLRDEFGPESVFFDIESISPGDDFRRVIRDRLAQVNVVLAVIGNNWKPDRLHTPNDFVRLELTEAFQRNKVLVPVLLDDAEIPHPDLLPPELDNLPYIQSMKLRSEPDFDTDISRIIVFLRGEVERVEHRQREMEQVLGTDRPSQETTVDDEPPAETHIETQWSGWTVRSITRPVEMALPELVDLLVEIVRAEGPVTFGRLSKLLAEASEARVRTRPFQTAVDRAIATAGRRRRLMLIHPYRGCEPNERIVAETGGPSVILRPLGEREFADVPLTELAAAAREALEDETSSPTNESVMRSVMSRYGVARMGPTVKEMLARAAVMARRAKAAESNDDDRWAEAHRAISIVPAGRWVTVGDIAEIADTSPAWVGRHMYGQRHLPGLHRMLEPDGRPWRWFSWVGEDRGPVIDVLRAEGSIPAGTEFADPEKRMGIVELRRGMSTSR